MTNNKTLKKLVFYHSMKKPDVNWTSKKNFRFHLNIQVVWLITIFNEMNQK